MNTFANNGYKIFESMCNPMGVLACDLNGGRHRETSILHAKRCGH